jgi:hypothetical protein
MLFAVLRKGRKAGLRAVRYGTDRWLRTIFVSFCRKRLRK